MHHSVRGWTYSSRLEAVNPPPTQSSETAKKTMKNSNVKRAAKICVADTQVSQILIMYTFMSW